MSLKVKVLIGVLVELYIVSQYGNVLPIGCFVCSSRNHSSPYCEDPFHPGYMNDSYREKCKTPKRKHVGEFPAHFCVKVIGKSYLTNEKVVIRRCTTHTMDNQCGNFQLEDELIRGCVLTCYSDGCNSSKSLRSFSWLILVTVSLSLWLSAKGAHSYWSNVT